MNNSTLNLKNRSCHERSQRGIALIVSLVMLVVITLIGIAVMGGSRLELLMANNIRYQSDAAARAEAAVRDGEFQLATGVFNPGIVGNNVPGLQPAPLPNDPRNPASWNTLPAANATTLSPGGTTNRYLVEYMGCSSPEREASNFNCNATCLGTSCRDIHTYRVWGYATDISGNTRIAQSVFTVTSTPITTVSQRIAYTEIKNNEPPNP